MTERDILTVPTEQQFVITHTLDAPRDLVFKAWTKAEHLVHWWGPKGFKIQIQKLDVQPGGIFHYVMRSANGQEMWGRFIYREIIAPERIVFINSFSDEKGDLTRAPFSTTWPLEVLNILTLTEHMGKTTLTLRGGPLNATDAELQTYVAMHTSMRQGFGGTFSQLTEYLPKMS